MQTRVRAIITKNHAVLLIRRVKADRTYWVFPGGGVEDHDESLQAALIRECKEELGVAVRVGRLFAERSLTPPGGVEQKELFFECEVTSGTIGTGTGPEFSRDSSVSGTYHIEWVPSASVSFKNIFPEEVRDKLASAL
ncbi:MAG: NUDIX domain-containing protein [Candidatus Pacebacteria bacterium]|nr:NUDIX domain-containing protein [Candidatus Paceibacterota bacterium]